MVDPDPSTRPGDEAERRRKFWAVVACVIVGLAMLIALRPDSDGSEDPEVETTATITESTTTTPVPESEAPLPVGKPVQGTAGVEVETLPPDDARPAADLFLDTWLRYQYGLDSASVIEAATPGCVASIRAVGVNTARLGRTGRVVAVRARRDRDGLIIYAQIDDGSRYGSYPVAFRFVERDGEWLCDGRIEET